MTIANVYLATSASSRVPVFVTSSSPDVEARVDSFLKKLALEEKVDLIGGVDDF